MHCQHIVMFDGKTERKRKRREREKTDKSSVKHDNRNHSSFFSLLGLRIHVILVRVSDSLSKGHQYGNLMMKQIGFVIHVFRDMK